jgi:hypothetical protein
MCIPQGTLRAYLDGELDAGERDRVAGHLAGCERCLALASVTAERGEQVRAWIDAAAAPEEPRPAAVALAELRTRLSTERTRPVLLGLVPRVSFAIVATAALAFVIWTTAHPGGRMPSSGARSTSTRLGSPAATRPAVPAATQPDKRPTFLDARVGGAEPGPVRMATKARAANARPARLARSGTRRIANVDRYLLLGDDLSRPDIGIIVRVKMPVSFPSSGGVFDDGSLYGEIEADVLVTQDGRPYAVRLVQDDSRIQGRK